MKKYAILDLDNCISDDLWRRDRIVPAHVAERQNFEIDRFDDYHALAPFDEVGNAHLLELFRTHVVLIFTGRPRVYEAPTLEWIKRKTGAQAFTLHMRNPGDRRQASVVKRAMLMRALSMGVRIEEIEHAYDDLDVIVEMYRSEGIATAEVAAIHNKEKFVS